MSKTKAQASQRVEIGQNVDDRFVPRRGEGVVVHEVKSRFKPRKYVLSMPGNRNAEALDFRDHFLWEQMNGESNLAALKQEYYNKFKALPTAHITELTRRLLQRGFLIDEEEGGVPLAEPRPKFVLSLRIPAGFFRNLLGPVGLILSSVFLFLPILLVALGALVYGVISQGPGAMLGIYNFEVPMTHMLIALVCAFYAIQAFRVLLEFGLLMRAPRFPGDLLEIGVWTLVPFFRVTTQGKVLKNWESRMVHAAVLMLYPFCLSCYALVLPSFVEVPDKIQLLLGLAVSAGFLDLIFQTCPFIDGAWVKIQNVILDKGASVRALARVYLEDLNHYMRERPREESRQVMLYYSGTFIWVIVGSSVLLFMTSMTVEGLMQEITPHLGHHELGMRLVRIALYSPLFFAFLGLFWKMLQPFVMSLLQHPLWHNSSYLCLGLIAIGAGFGLMFFALPQTLSRALFVIYILVSMTINFKSISGRAFWFQMHFVQWMAVAAVLVFATLLPDMPGANVVIALAIFGWHILAMWSVSPKPSLFWGICCLVAVAASAVPSIIIPLVLHIPASEFIAFSLPISTAVALLLLTIGGKAGTHFILGALACISFQAGYLNSSSGGIGEVLLMMGLVLLELEMWGLKISLNQRARFISSFLVHHPKGHRKSADASITGFVRDCWGAMAVNAHHKSVPDDYRFLRFWELWVGKWLNSIQFKKAMSVAIGAVPWDKRKDVGEVLQVNRLGELEQTCGVTRNQRRATLHEQLPFRSLSAAELDALCDRLVPVMYQEGEQIVGMGEEGHDYLEIIVQGEAMVQTRRASDGQASFLAMLAQGDAVRNKDLIKSTPYPFSVMATMETLSLRLYRNHFVEWCQMNEGVFARIQESIDLADRISNLSLFRDFSISQMRLLVNRLSRREVSAKTTLITQGEEGDDFYILHQGEVEVLIDKKRVARLQAGSYFGEIALIEKCMRTATVRTTRPSVVYTLDQSAFDHFFAAGRAAQVLINVGRTRAESSRAS